MAWLRQMCDGGLRSWHQRSGNCMAYNVYFSCDHCGGIGAAWINHSVSLSLCEKIARDAGWKVGKRGWICPMCQKKEGRR